MSHRKIAILVAGMHRSGTSALSRSLNLVGCDLPKTLMEPVPGNNDVGFWESQPLSDLNDHLLRSTGSDWKDWRPFRFGLVCFPDGRLVPGTGPGVALPGIRRQPAIRGERSSAMPIAPLLDRGAGNVRRRTSSRIAHPQSPRRGRVPEATRWNRRFLRVSHLAAARAGSGIGVAESQARIFALRDVPLRTARGHGSAGSGPQRFVAEARVGSRSCGDRAIPLSRAAPSSFRRRGVSDESRTLTLAWAVLRIVQSVESRGGLRDGCRIAGSNQIGFRRSDTALQSPHCRLRTGGRGARRTHQGVERSGRGARRTHRGIERSGRGARRTHQGVERSGRGARRTHRGIERSGCGAQRAHQGVERSGCGAQRGASRG